MQRPISDLRLERYALGELDSQDVQLLEAQLEHDQNAQERLSYIRSSQQEIANRYPAKVFLRQVKERASIKEKKSKSFFEQYRYGLMAVVTVALCLLIINPGSNSTQQGQQIGVRTKGIIPSLMVHQIEKGKVAQLRESDVVVSGAQIQLSVANGGGRHAVVVSIDGRSNVTLHYPLEGQGQQIADESIFSLPQSYELDAAPSFERFFLVTSDQPINVERVLSSANKLGKQINISQRSDLPGLADTQVQDSFLLRKGVKP